MAAFVLTWNPARVPIADEVYAQRVAQTLRGEPEVGPWSTGQNRHRIKPGDTLYWLRQGPHGRGLMGGGRALTGVFQDEHWSEPGKTANYVQHAWDVLLPVEDRLPTEELLLAAPRVPWNHLQGSGYQVPAHSEALLAGTWAQHLASVGRYQRPPSGRTTSRGLPPA